MKSERKSDRIEYLFLYSLSVGDANHVALEPLVASLKEAYGALPPSKRRPIHDARYDHALLILLALYFKEQAA